MAVKRPYRRLANLPHHLISNCTTTNLYRVVISRKPVSTGNYATITEGFLSREIMKSSLISPRPQFYLDRGNGALLYEKKRSPASANLVRCREKRFNLVRRGYHTNTSHCPETRRRANGWSRQGRIKALPNVAVPVYGTLRCAEPKLSPGGLSNRVGTTWFARIAPAELLLRGAFCF